jgi:glycosyltransferase involved in cell wall biosynthesis
MRPLVSITIPTHNSEAFLGRCLDAVYAQTYKDIEVNVVDGFSRDETKAIAGKYPLALYEDEMGLLNARKLGVEKSSGQFVLLLDSDQILEPDAIENAVRLIQEEELDMLVLEEDVFRNKTFLEMLFHLDRKLIHSVKDFSPFTGVMLPRFYKKAILQQAFQAIPQSALQSGGQDHAIIYYEVWQITRKVDLLPNAVKHIEPSTLREIVPKFYRWGYTSHSAREAKYKDMLQTKERFRKGMFQKGLWLASFGSIALLMIKGIPYVLGRAMGSLRARK